jgi:hypothetical protein
MAAQVDAVKRAREHYPCWGKDKLAIVRKRQGVVLSATMIGRILAVLKRSHARARPYEIRKPKDHPAA